MEFFDSEDAIRKQRSRSTLSVLRFSGDTLVNELLQDDKSPISFQVRGGVRNPSQWHRTIQFKCQNSSSPVICHLSKDTCIQTKCLTLFMLRILWTVYHVLLCAALCAPPPTPQHAVLCSKGMTEFKSDSQNFGYFLFLLDLYTMSERMPKIWYL